MPRKNSSKKIVALGGGNAMPKTVLAGLKNYPVNLTVISSVLDNGGSAGKLREFTSISFGDIRRAALALSQADDKTKNHFSQRDWSGHVMANVFCAARMAVSGNAVEVITELNKRLKVPTRYQILPATIEKAELCAVLENGKVIVGETNIDIPKHNVNLKIKKVFLTPKVKAYPEALKAIKSADLVVIGPGDLYSSLAQILLVEGMSDALRKSRAKKVLVCNSMTKRGETNGFRVADFVKEIEKLLGEKLDFVIYNTKQPSQAQLLTYKKEHPELLSLVENNTSDPRFIGDAFINSFGEISYRPDKLAKTILSLCKP
ncbi:MAG: gluconeogenesis factor YvcK family protein [Candidatus Nealsonbacteria bacterium]